MIRGRLLFKRRKRGLCGDETLESSTAHEEAAVPDVHPAETKQQGDATRVQEVAMDDDMIAKEQLIVGKADSTQGQVFGNRGHNRMCCVESLDLLAVEDDGSNLNRDLRVESIVGSAVCLGGSFTA